MTESKTSRALHNSSLASKAIGAALGGPFRERTAAPTPTPMAPHGYTLQCLISIIKNSQQRSPSQQN